MQLSQFVHTIETDASIILFNTVNSAIIKFEPKYFVNNELQLDLLTPDELEYLTTQNFFIEKSDVLEIFLNSNNEPSWLDIIISLTESCNLHCKYCYENNFTSSHIIEYETIDKIIKYINQTIEKHPTIKTVKFDLIGGEPLIAVQQLKYLVEKIDSSVNAHAIYCLETNGTIFNKYVQDILKNLEVTVHISLTMPSDHNKMRPFHNGVGTFDVIMKNLCEAEDFFKDQKHTLSIRYNAHMDNVTNYDEFITFIKNKLKFKFEQDYALVINYDYNDFNNSIPIEKYKKSNLDVNFKYAPNPYDEDNFLLLPQNYQHCLGYSPYSVKIFSDGTLGICNAWMYNDRRGSIDDLLAGITKMSIFPEIEKEIPIDEKCTNCKNLFLCGGKRLCRRENQCNFVDFSIEDYLIRYAKGGEF